MICRISFQNTTRAVVSFILGWDLSLKGKVIDLKYICNNSIKIKNLQDLYLSILHQINIREVFHVNIKKVELSAMRYKFNEAFGARLVFVK